MRLKSLNGVSLVLLLITRGAGAADLEAGQRAFEHRCGVCHLAGGTGSQMLEKRLGRERALLAQRTDLPPAYVIGIVRSGLRSMPPLTRVEVPDPQLDDIAAYLARLRANLPQGTP